MTTKQVIYCNNPSLLKHAARIVTDPSGNLYVDNFPGLTIEGYNGGLTSYIVKIDTAGNATRISPEVTDSRYTGMVYLDGYLYVCGTNYYVYQINVITGVRTTIADFTFLGVNFTLHIVYFAPYFYVSGIASGSPCIIKMIKDTWTYTTLISSNANNPTSIAGMTVSNSGVLYITHVNKETVTSFNGVDGSWISTFTMPGLNPKNILFYNNYLYCSIIGLNYISKYDLTGNLIKSDYATGTTVNTTCLAFDSEGSFYTVNMVTTNGVSNSQIIKVFTPAVIACFKEDSLILTNKGYCPVQDLRKGDLIKTMNHEFLPINMIGCREINHLATDEHIKDQLYKCSKEEYPQLVEDLILTGCHSILVNEFSSLEERKKVKEMNGGLFRTENVFRLPACLDNRACVYEIKGKYKVYHLALENVNDYSNYGIYANGLLVESCSKRCLKEYSNMKLIE